MSIKGVDDQSNTELKSTAPVQDMTYVPPRSAPIAIPVPIPKPITPSYKKSSKSSKSPESPILTCAPSSGKDYGMEMLFEDEHSPLGTSPAKDKKRNKISF